LVNIAHAVATAARARLSRLQGRPRRLLDVDNDRYLPGLGEAEAVEPPAIPRLLWSAVRAGCRLLLL
jgi:hypothetical protein